MLSKSIHASLFFILLISLVWAATPAAATSLLQESQSSDVPTGDPAAVIPTGTQTPTNPPPQTGSSDRALVVISSYSADTDSLKPGQDFTAKFSLINKGQNPAANITVSFTPGDLIPRNNGGIVSQYQLNPVDYRRHPEESEGGKTFSQPMTISPATALGAVASCSATITYTDMTTGVEYSGSFTMAFHVDKQPVYTGPALPTATATAVLRPQLVISSYASDVTTLQPGVEFKLSLEIRNLGNTVARSVTMVVGGGTSTTGSSSGTPEPGGVSGTGGDFSNFAPLKSSNIQFLGDIKTGEAIHASQDLIVNVSTNPGAYSMKFSFLYTDERGVRYTDDQVITLLVYNLPLVEVSFYREAGPFFAGQPGPLPLQIVNLSRKQTVLGNMKVTSKGGQITNSTTLVGALDPGGYFPLDANLIPDQSGPLDIDITVTYTDDFNQPRVINQSLSINVEDTPVIENPLGPDGKPINPDQDPVVSEVEETILDQVVRFLKGLVGLDSGKEQPVQEVPNGEGQPLPSEGQPGNSKPIIVPAPPLKSP